MATFKSIYPVLCLFPIGGLNQPCGAGRYRLARGGLFHPPTILLLATFFFLCGIVSMPASGVKEVV